MTQRTNDSDKCKLVLKVHYMLTYLPSPVSAVLLDLALCCQTNYVDAEPPVIILNEKDASQRVYLFAPNSDAVPCRDQRACASEPLRTEAETLEIVKETVLEDMVGVLFNSAGNWLLFKYNGEYFQQHEGTAMGTWTYRPRTYFVVFDTKAISLYNFVAKLNNRFPTIKFTYEVEHNEQLPFLDVLVIKNSENKLEFDVNRKETATLRYITNNSHHPFQHKMASFNLLIHRLLNFPLSKEWIEHEKQLIKNIAKNNGCSVYLIDKLIRKHTFKRTLYNSTTFRRDTDNSKFASNVTNSRQLDAFESLEIIKCNSSMNKDNGPIPTSPVFALINKDSYGSVNRGNKFSINSA
ncbi:hypothetical protein NQ318_003017, partial [Aromia moschata]